MKSILTALTLGSLVGCAKAPPESATGTNASSAMQGAREIGAADVPQAALHLQLAKENIEAAQALKEDNRDEEAESLLLRAEADAQLALLLAREEKEKNDAGDAMERVRKLLEDNS